MPLSYLVDSVVDGSPTVTPFDDHGWRKLVGVDIARRTRPLRLDRGTLTILVASSAWAQELALMEAALLDRLRRSGLDAKKVRFKVGRVAAPTREPERQGKLKKVPPSAPLPPQVDRAVAAVDDPELRAAIQLAAQRNLAWQRAHAEINAAPPTSPALPRAGAETARSARAAPTAPSSPRGKSAAGRGSRRSPGGR